MPINKVAKLNETRVVNADDECWKVYGSYTYRDLASLGRIDRLKVLYCVNSVAIECASFINFTLRMCPIALKLPKYVQTYYGELHLN